MKKKLKMDKPAKLPSLEEVRALFKGVNEQEEKIAEIIHRADCYMLRRIDGKEEIRRLPSDEVVSPVELYETIVCLLRELEKR